MKKLDTPIFEKGKFLQNYSMKNLNTWKVGGTARYYFEPGNIDELRELRKWAYQNNIKVLVLGKGSNVLISDSGFDGVVINLTKTLRSYFINEKEGFIEVQAGVLLPTLSIQLSRKNIEGYDFFAGIPGTMGGAVVMNAGCIGKETKNYLLAVTYMDQKGNIIEKSINDLSIGFRTSEFIKSDRIIVSCKLKYKKGNGIEECLEKTKRAINIRKEKFPLNVATAGSTFKSPPNGPYPGKIIEEIGLKGYRIGGAMISKQHGNWIINTGSATSDDIKNLIDYIKTRVYNETKIKLETEVVYI